MPVPVMSSVRASRPVRLRTVLLRLVCVLIGGGDMGVPRTTSWQLPRVRIPYYAHLALTPPPPVHCECYVLPSQPDQLQENAALRRERWYKCSQLSKY